MSFSVTQETFQNLTSYWNDPASGLKWGSIFILPAWLETWWCTFEPETELYLTVVRDGPEIIGIAPLHLKGKEARFVGSSDVCDYQDFVLVPGREAEFFNALLDDLSARGVWQLKLDPVRPDSTVIFSLADVVEKRGGSLNREEIEVTLEMALPASWEEYLGGLDKKQRHEVRRKLRRLWGADDVRYRCHEVGPQDVDELTDTFLKLFSLSRVEKAGFMTEQMQAFFHALAGAMVRTKLLRYGILEVESRIVAMIMGFDYNGAMYLYNSAYDPQYDYLSVGVLSKVLCIKESINQGRKKWDFLKGAEKYKYQLGGSEVRLYDCRVIIK